MRIEWNRVTWYSKLVAVVVFLITAGVFFELGSICGSARTEVNLVDSSHGETHSSLSGAVLSMPVGNVLPTKIGQCVITTVAATGTRLVSVDAKRDDVPVPGSGSDITYSDGGHQVSYDTVSGIENSRIGDKIRLCLVSLPSKCPPGDNRGKIYDATDMRTRMTWELPDSEHFCGGA